MGTKPLCLLDVDGVFNVFYAVLGVANPHLHRHTVQIGFSEYRLTLDRRHRDLVAMLESAFDLVWATAWEDHANEHICQILGLPELPVIGFPRPRQYDRRLHWKTKTVAAYTAGRPFCWIDDETGGRDAEYLSAANPRSLIITCDPAEGLGEPQVFAALDFAAAVAAAEPANQE